MANLSKIAQAKQIAAQNAEIRNDIESLAVMLKDKKYITKEAQEILKKYLPAESEITEDVDNEETTQLI